MVCSVCCIFILRCSVCFLQFNPLTHLLPFIAVVVAELCVPDIPFSKWKKKKIVIVGCGFLCIDSGLFIHAAIENLLRKHRMCEAQGGSKKYLNIKPHRHSVESKIFSCVRVRCLPILRRWRAVLLFVRFLFGSHRKMSKTKISKIWAPGRWLRIYAQIFDIFIVGTTLDTQQ